MSERSKIEWNSNIRLPSSGVSSVLCSSFVLPSVLLLSQLLICVGHMPHPDNYLLDPARGNFWFNCNPTSGQCWSSNYQYECNPNQMGNGCKMQGRSFYVVDMFFIFSVDSLSNICNTLVTPHSQLQNYNDKKKHYSSCTSQQKYI